jgi:dihydroflavonol-4-reductase
MKYLVTGATGFLGRHLTRQLRGEGHTVLALARHAPGDFAETFGVSVVQGDVLDRSSLDAATKGCDGIFHCAGKVSRDAADAESLHRVHVLGTRHVMEAARAAHVRRVVVASTSGTVALSEDPDWISSEDSPTPTALIQRFPYYRSKLYAEQEAFAHARDGLEVLCVNPSLLLGPGDVYGSSTHDVRLFLDRAVPAVPSGGMSYVDARDAADGMVRAMTRGEPGKRYLLTGSNCTVREFFARLERISGVPAPRLALPKSASLARAGTEFLGRMVKKIGGELPVDPVSVEMAQLFWYVDSTRAERELGWHARDPIDTLVDTVGELRS